MENSRKKLVVENPLVTARRLTFWSSSSCIWGKYTEKMFSLRSLFCTSEMSQLCFCFTSVEVLPSEGWIPHSCMQVGSCMEWLIWKC